MFEENKSKKPKFKFEEKEAVASDYLKYGKIHPGEQIGILIDSGGQIHSYGNDTDPEITEIITVIRIH